MKGGFDLNGRYYPNSEDAINAEMAQCAEIDARAAYDRSINIERDLQRNSQTYSQYIEDLQYQINMLEERMKKLEEIKSN